MKQDTIVIEEKAFEEFCRKRFNRGYRTTSSYWDELDENTREANRKESRYLVDLLFSCPVFVAESFYEIPDDGFGGHEIRADNGTQDGKYIVTIEGGDIIAIIKERL